MKKTFLFKVTAMVCFVTITMNSQSYIGNNIDNYSGIQGLTFNPANVVNSPFKADINLLSASVFGGSDYLGINVQDIINSDGGFDFDVDAEKFPKDDNNFFFNADILGPSFMFNLNKKSSIAISTRVRAFLNINNISGDLYESIADDGFDEADDFDINMKDFKGTIHAWAEIGLTYGRILVNNENNLLKGGVTLKYLQGAGSAFFSAPTISGQYDSVTQTLSTNGSLSYGVSQEDFDTDDIEYENLTAGFGADIGLMYQLNNKNAQVNDSISVNYTPYKVKFGISVTDIGSINYKEGEITQYDLNQSVDANEFDSEDDVDQVLEDNYNGVTTNSAVKVNLPTAVHVLVDYKIRNRLYTSVSGSFSLNGDAKPMQSSIINSVTVAPRLETKWFSIYSPVSFRQYGDLSWGAGFRFGPLMVGSGSVLTNLLSSSTKTTDVYVGLKIPFYRKHLRKQKV